MWSKIIGLGATFAVIAPVVACSSEAGQGAAEPSHEGTSVLVDDRPATCGGFLGAACPEAGQICVDDPCDDCDPAKGGSDCQGICMTPDGAPACRGLAGLMCTGGMSCVDDPRDDCPGSGSADCAGFCVNAACPDRDAQ